MNVRLTAQEVIMLLADAPEVLCVQVKTSKNGDGTRGTARVELSTGQLFYVAVNTVRGIDAPNYRDTQE